VATAPRFGLVLAMDAQCLKENFNIPGFESVGVGQTRICPESSRAALCGIP
jgi:hypothetical protein